MAVSWPCDKTPGNFLTKVDTRDAGVPAFGHCFRRDLGWGGGGGTIDRTFKSNQ